MFVMPVGYFKKNTSVYMGAILEEYNMMYILEPDAKILFFVSSTKKKVSQDASQSHFIPFYRKTLWTSLQKFEHVT